MSGLKLGDTISTPYDGYYNHALRNARIEAGYSQQQLAKRTGISNSLICYYERLRQFPLPEHADSIARILGKKVDELFPEWMREYGKLIRSERKHKRPGLPKSEDALDYTIQLDEKILRELSVTRKDEPLIESDKVLLSKRLQEVLLTLRRNEREVIKRRYGLGYESQTQQEIADSRGCTRSNVGQIEERAMRKMQQPKIKLKLVDFVYDK